ncbi:MAG: LPS assembly lipoprotein LptE [Chloroflexota bacterium]|jgi:outer membrane lipopolysaccharide assembly protein LptE/RlpB|nr:LptE family protein [Lentimicrobium sp.]
MESTLTKVKTGFSRNGIQLLVFCSFILTLAGCGVYSFTGASIPPEAKTISILNFPNKSELVQPSLSQTFTEKLKDRFSSQTSLNLVPRNGDLHIEGEITGYTTEPVAISGEQTAQLIRLKITVNVRFINKFDEKASYESTFSRYYDYPSNLDLRQVEEEAISNISDALVEDIFNKSVVNW